MFNRKVFRLVILLITMAIYLNNLIPASHAATASETFGSASYGIQTSGLTATIGGNTVTTSSQSGAYFGSSNACANNIVGYCQGGVLALQNISADLIITFPASQTVTNFDFLADAVNGARSVTVKYANNSTSNITIPDGSSIGFHSTISGTGTAGNSIKQLIFYSSVHSTDYWLLDNLNWTYSSTVQLSTPSFSSYSATSGVAKSIDLTWAAISNASSYSIKIYDAGGSNLLNTLNSVSGTSKTINSSNYALFQNATTYQVSITAIGDAVTYSDSSESIKVSVTTITVTPTISLSISSSGKTVTKFLNVTVTATLSDTGTVTFFANGRSITGCKSQVASTNSISCNWKPLITGPIVVSASMPARSGYTGAISSPLFLTSLKRGLPR